MPFTYEYPRPAVATDCVVFGFDGRDLKVLLIERGLEPFKGMWAFPGGFLRMDETAECGAMRELMEETGLRLSYMNQLKTFSRVNRDPRERVISVAFYALVRRSEVQGGDDASQAKWFSINDVPQLAFDHDYILREAMNRLKKDIHFEPVGFDLLDETFTIPQLQRLYEAILGVAFDRRNFQKKMLQMGILSAEAEEEEPQYFGSHSEMCKMAIDNLFCSRVSPAKNNVHFQNAMLALNEDADEKASVGRKGKKYRFNKKKYDQMKRDGNFRLEF